MRRGTVIVVPHFDDEVYQAGALLVTYEHDINIIITHPTDTVSRNTFLAQQDMFLRSLKLFENYRKTIFDNPGRIKVDICDKSGPTGLLDRDYLDCIKLIEENVFSFDIVDNYVFSLRSGHQSHVQSNLLAMSVLRHDYLARMRKVLVAPYPVSYYTPTNHSTEDKDYNSFIKMSKDAVDVLMKSISEEYIAKSPVNSILGAEAFKVALRFFGITVGAEYAQPFIIKRLVE